MFKGLFMRNSLTKFLLAACLCAGFAWCGARADAGVAVDATTPIGVMAEASWPALLSGDPNTATVDPAGLVLLPVHGMNRSAGTWVEASSKVAPGLRGSPTEVMAEPIPTPSALASGLLVLGGLAAFRLARRFKRFA